jgi:hypothetical protein
MMNNDHLVHFQDVIESVELIAGKKIGEREKNLFLGFIQNTYGQGYQKAANQTADIVYNEKFKLSPEHFEWFMSIHRSHMKALGTENQKKYSLPNVLDVKYDKQKDCLKVYYADEWWHYDRRGTWY